jgi:TorA maturation chaperone TorD
MKNYILTISKNENENLKDFTIFMIENEKESVLNYGSYYLSNEKYIIEELKANYENLQIER